MTIYELGLFRNSVLAYHRKFYDIKNHLDDTEDTRRSNIISLISRMSKAVLNDEILSLEVPPKFQIIFRNLHQQNNSETPKQNMFAYAISDENSSKKIVSGLLTEVLKQFIAKYAKKSHKISIEKTSEYALFSKELEKILIDEQLLPSDRLEFIF